MCQASNPQTAGAASTNGYLLPPAAGTRSGAAAVAPHPTPTIALFQGKMITADPGTRRLSSRGVVLCEGPRHSGQERLWRTRLGTNCLPRDQESVWLTPQKKTKVTRKLKSVKLHKTLSSYNFSFWSKTENGMMVFVPKK